MTRILFAKQQNKQISYVRIRLQSFRYEIIANKAQILSILFRQEKDRSEKVEQKKKTKKEEIKSVVVIKSNNNDDDNNNHHASALSILRCDDKKIDSEMTNLMRYLSTKMLLPTILCNVTVQVLVAGVRSVAKG